MIDRSWEWARSHSRLRTNPIHQEEEINIVLTETFELEDSYIEEVNRGGTFHVQARFYKLMGEFKINSFKPNLYKLYTDHFSPALHRMITALSWRVRCLPVTELALHLHLGMLRGWVLLPMSWASSHLFVRFLVLTCFKSMYDVKLQENLNIYIYIYQNLAGIAEADISYSGTTCFTIDSATTICGSVGPQIGQDPYWTGLGGFHLNSIRFAMGWLYSKCSTLIQLTPLDFVGSTWWAQDNCSWHVANLHIYRLILIWSVHDLNTYAGETA